MKHGTVSESGIPKVAIWVLLALAVSCRVPDSGPPIGHPIPMIVAKDLAGQTHIISSLNAPCVFFFFTPSCQPCNLLLDYLTSLSLQPDTSPLSLFLVVRRDKQQDLVQRSLPGFPVLLIDRRIWRNTFRILRTPVLLFYDSQSRLRKKHFGWNATSVQRNLLENLIREARKASSPRPRLSNTESVQLTQTNPRR